MRTASLVLGIVGGVLAILFGVFFVLGSEIVSQVAGNAIDGADIEINNRTFELPFGTVSSTDDMVCLDTESFSLEIKNAHDISGRITAAGKDIARIGMLVIAGLSFLGGALAIWGGALSSRSHLNAGVMMLGGALLSVFTILGVLAAVLLIIGGVLALIPLRRKTPQQQAQKPSAKPE